MYLGMVCEHLQYIKFYMRFKIIIKHCQLNSSFDIKKNKNKTKQKQGEWLLGFLERDLFIPQWNNISEICFQYCIQKCVSSIVLIKPMISSCYMIKVKTLFPFAPVEFNFQ